MKYILLLAIFSVLLFADDNDLSKMLEETTQIATKTRINADYVPGTVSIITGEELKALGIQNLNQPNALDMIVGMDSSVNSLRGSGAIYGGLGNKIKWLINGRAVSSQIWGGSVTGRGNIVFPFAVEQIDRVEIIRGPDSAIYGDNAIFGVINIITNKDNNFISLGYGYQGSDKSYKSLSTNMFYAKDKLSLSLSTFYYEDDGYPIHIGKSGESYNWWNGAQTPSYGPGELQTGSKGYNFLFDISYGESRFWANRLYMHSKQGAFGTWNPSVALPREDNGYKLKDIVEQIGVSHLFTVGGASIEAKIGYDQTTNNLDRFLELDRYLFSNWFDMEIGYKYKETKKYASLDINKKYLSHNFLLGLAAQEIQNVESKAYANYSNVLEQIDYQYTSPFLVSENTKRIQNAFYFQDVWDVTNAATLIFGARYDHFKGDVESTGWSPRIAFVYRLNEQNILKAQYARAFRVPTFAELGGYYDRGQKYNLKSEKVDTFELGHIYKTESFSLKNTVFESRIYDMIAINSVDYTTINMPNMGKIQGLESEIKYSANNYEVGFNQGIYKTYKDDRTYRAGRTTYQYKGGSFALAPSYIANIFVKLNQHTSYPTTIWFHYIGSKPRNEEITASGRRFTRTLNGSNGNVPPQCYLNVTQQFKNVFKDFDIAFGVQNLFGKTQKTLYVPLNSSNNQDTPYMGQRFWFSVDYRF